MDNQRFHLLCREVPVVSLILDRELNIQDINSLGCEQLGYSRSELLGTPYPMLCIPEEREYMQQNLTQSLNEVPCLKRWDCSHIRKNGTRYWARDTARFVEGPEGETFILIASEDITETRYLISELEKKSYLDELTGLYNRRRFNRHLDEILLSIHSGQDSHALFFIDLDQFKAINDSCGHLCGDQLLIQIADLLRKHTRKQDVLARLGGDEFGLILHSCSRDEARLIGQKLLQTFSQYRFFWEGKYFSVSASLGYTLIESGMRSDANDLLRQADAACYLAKERGRNRVEMYDTHSNLIKQRDSLHTWYNRINQALDQSLFVLFSQEVIPISKRTNGEKAHEVLIRMKGPGGEIIPPGAFFPAADYYHLSPRIDLWVMEEVIRHFLSLPEPDGNTYFINLSGLTLSDTNYIRTTTRLLPQFIEQGLKLCFEITESVAIHHLDSARFFIDKFKALGCRFALDDFGSGFSSFGYLKTLPVDIIKIDGEFIRDIINDPADHAMVIAIHEVSKALEKLTVAEYVEDEAIFNKLREMGIDYVQGYYIGKPHPLFGGRQ
ncbi:MAG TPA: EAL domain-containing protein [Sedimenticola thiotaurini]|uniref:EAL domain-containing protein n=1 Tax=Sedimenticola thiotaurini TaxID=1543721 RepID=A0A831RPI0_9GAMM|nr:EAL domain-containing protein [Sedimenticola thiotaurini]